MRRFISGISSAAVLLFAGEALALTGGPDAAGYRFADEAEGIVYNYVDITGTGTLVVSGNNAEGTAVLGASFDLYGDTLGSLTVTTNGVITDDTGVSSDSSNDCPLPAAPSGGTGHRIYAPHDDYATDVYYEYFDSAAATAIGFPGTTNGVSVIQWVGEHVGGTPDAVDFEVILDHDTGAFLVMVEADEETGLGSTLGLQNDGASTGLAYGCNTPDFIVPGTTAVLFFPGTPPDSDCCTASGSNTPGCTDLSCQNATCAADSACCDTDWDATCATNANDTHCTLLCQGVPPPVTINEIRIDQTGTDFDEYFELAGPPFTSLGGMSYLVIGDVPTGIVEEVTNLTGQYIRGDGFFAMSEGSLNVGTADEITFLNFENDDTVTHLLVTEYTGALTGENVDVDTDGVIDDPPPWTETLDTVAIVDNADAELPYGPALNCAAGPTCAEIDSGGAAAQMVFRCPDADGTWLVGPANVAAVPMRDSPGEPNICPFCGDGWVDAGEDCDGNGAGVGGETADCDADCTDQSCGDGTVNATALEECDDAGESATCDADCTVAECLDGTVNATAGEECDDGAESEDCDTDCTFAACLDGTVNATAGEECDDGAESMDCDTDCTDAICGDSTVNPTAGETCDPGEKTDMCDADCTAATCGDGYVNAEAGEECDGDGAGAGGETADCDDDCTNAMCGDGVVNATALEECDDGDESEDCDDDCTAVECGDSNVNEAAGEECDDGAESEDCDEDCTAAECGDGDINATAGEECDDGNTDDGDGCSAACLEEDPPGTGTGTGTGTDTDSGSGSDTDSGSGTGDDSSGTDATATMTATSGSASASGSSTTPTSGADTSAGGETDTDSGGADGGAAEDGCGCRSDGGSGAGWSLLGLLGLLGLRRRRRAA